MPVRRSDNLTTFICRFCYDLVASPSWGSQGLSRSLMALLYSTVSNSKSVICLVVWRLRFVDPNYNLYYLNYWHDLDSCRY